MRSTFLWLAAGCVLAAAVLSGCATTIRPPETVREATEVFIVDHGRTTSLVIPASQGGMLRYAYGDWNWYALGRTDSYHGIAALLWPTRGALGRAQFSADPTPESVRMNVRSTVQAVHAVRVERSRVLALEQSLESLYDSRRKDEVANPAAGLRFVPHPQDYTYFSNSNHMIATWLRELGCRTKGLSYHASWRVSGASE